MDDVAVLVKDIEQGRDKAGNPIAKRVERPVFCQVFSVARNEFYSAATAGLHPEIILRLSDFLDYDGETLVRYPPILHGKPGPLYSVIRAYRSSGSMHRGGSMPLNALELTLQRKVGDGK